jgi:hypothetical protein
MIGVGKERIKNLSLQLLVLLASIFLMVGPLFAQDEEDLIPPEEEEFIDERENHEEEADRDRENLRKGIQSRDRERKSRGNNDRSRSHSGNNRQNMGSGFQAGKKSKVHFKLVNPGNPRYNTK